MFAVFSSDNLEFLICVKFTTEKFSLQISF